MAKLGGRRVGAGRKSKAAELGLADTLLKNVSIEELITILVDLIKANRTPAAVKVKAIEMILNRVYGMPSANVDVTTGGEKITMIGVTAVDYRNGLTALAPRPDSDSDTPG